MSRIYSCRKTSIWRESRWWDFPLKGPLKDRRQITSLARAIDMTNSALGGGVVSYLPFFHLEDLQYAEAVRAMCEDKDSVAICAEGRSPE